MPRWLPLLLVACSGTDPEPTPTVEAELTVEPGPLPGIMVARVTTSEDAIVELTYGLESTDLPHPELSSGGTEHTFTVLGLKAGRDYQFEASASAIDSSGRTDVVTATVAPLAEEVPTFTVTDADPGAMCHPNGYAMFVWIQGGASGVSIVDMDGDTVWSLPLVDVPYQASRAQLSHDGTSVVYTTADALRQDLIGEVVVQPLDGSEPTVISAPTAHHDVVPLTDGSVAWLGYSFGPYECSGGNTLENAALDTIEEAMPGGAPAVVYDMFEDYPYPLDCSTGSGIFLPGRYDLTHSNSLMYRSSDDAYFHLTRWHDNLIKVDRATGAHQWEFGGANSDFEPADGQDPEDLFFHAHMSDIWNGGLLIFDNNDPGPSWVREYTLDESARTWEQVWSWNTGAFELLLGDVRRMPECSDHVLVTQSTSGVVRELLQDADGTTVWRMEPEVPQTIVTRVEYIPDLYDPAMAKLPPSR